MSTEVIGQVLGEVGSAVLLTGVMVGAYLIVRWWQTREPISAVFRLSPLWAYLVQQLSLIHVGSTYLLDTD